MFSILLNHKISKKLNPENNIGVIFKICTVNNSHYFLLQKKYTLDVAFVCVYYISAQYVRYGKNREEYNMNNADRFNKWLTLYKIPTVFANFDLTNDK